MIFALIFSISSCEYSKKDTSVCFTAEDLKKSLFSNNSQEEDLLLKCFFYRETKEQQIRGFESPVTTTAYVNMKEPKVEELNDLIMVAVMKPNDKEKLGKSVSFAFADKDKYLEYKSEIFNSFKWSENSTQKKEFFFTTINDIEYGMELKKESSEGNVTYFIIVSPKKVLEISGDI